MRPFFNSLLAPDYGKRKTNDTRCYKISVLKAVLKPHVTFYKVKVAYLKNIFFFSFSQIYRVQNS